MTREQAINVGDWVHYPARRKLNGEGIGRVKSVTGDGIRPCKCCGLGVSVEMRHDPNVTLGFPPHELTKLDRPPVATHGAGAREEESSDE